MDTEPRLPDWAPPHGRVHVWATRHGRRVHVQRGCASAATITPVDTHDVLARMCVRCGPNVVAEARLLQRRRNRDDVVRMGGLTVRSLASPQCTHRTSSRAWLGTVTALLAAGVDPAAVHGRHRVVVALPQAACQAVSPPQQSGLRHVRPVPADLLGHGRLIAATATEMLDTPSAVHEAIDAAVALLRPVAVGARPRVVAQ